MRRAEINALLSPLLYLYLGMFLSLSLSLSLTPAQAKNPPGLTLSTPYPAQVVELGKTITLSLTVRNTELPPQIVRLEMLEIPEGWKATFLGGGQIIKALYVDSDDSATVSLKLEPPSAQTPGLYRFRVVVQGQDGRARSELPLELSVAERLPPRLQFDVELPTLRGTPGSTLRYRATLKNDSDEELLINLDSEAPEGFTVRFKLGFGSQEVTSFPLKAAESKSLDIEVMPPRQTSAGDYPIRVRALSGEAQAALQLTATVTGQAELTVTTPEGRVSAEATAGRETPLKIIVRNNGSAPARDVELSASPPFGWSVEFDPKKIAEIPPNGEAEALAKIKPSEKAVAGDYTLSISARSQAEGSSVSISDSEQFRITVMTSTIWGIVGVILIAVALGVVGLAVARFGRR